MNNQQADTDAVNALADKLKTDTDNLISKFKSDLGVLFSALPDQPPVVVTPPPVIIPPPVNTNTGSWPSIVTSVAVVPIAKTVNVTPAKTTLVIDGSKYPSGTEVVIKPGTYAIGITLQNLTGVTVTATGVILDGLSGSKNGFYNTFTLSNLNNVVINGGTTKNNGYFMLYINTKLNGLVWNNPSFINCNQGIYFNTKYTWDGTDNTVVMNNCKFLNGVFDGASLGCNGGGAVIDGKNVVDLIKNLEIANCIIGNNDDGEFFMGIVQGLAFHDNTIKNYNPTNNDDNRIIKISGNGDVYNNTFDTIEGHAVALWPATFGSTPITSHFYNNTITNVRRYAGFEFQEFAAFNIPGKTVKSDLVVDGNTVGNINTDHWTGYPGTFIDNYQGYAAGTLGGGVTLTNNKGYNWWPAPTLPTLWNLAKPTVVSGNTYTN